MYKRILVPIDGSATSIRGAEEAIRIAQETKGHLCFVHVVDIHAYSVAFDGISMRSDILSELHEAGRGLLDRAQALATAKAVSNSSVMVDSVAGTIAPTIVGQAKDQKADLIVIGTHGRRGIRRMLLGSDATAVVSQARVPVLLVRSPLEEESSAG